MIRLLCPAVSLIALTLSTASVAQTTSARSLFEKYDLLGFFAIDCSQPASRANPYTVFRANGDAHVQRDMMISQTERLTVSMIDSASEIGPNRLAYSLATEAARLNLVIGVEPRRIRVLEMTNEKGETVVSAGRLIKDNTETKWFNRCD